MNKNHPHGAPQPDTPTATTEREADDAMLELQTLWDGLCQEVSDSLANNPVRLRRVKPEFFHILRHHRWKVVAHWLLTVCCLFAAVYWAFTMVEYTTCLQVTAAHLLEGIFILVAAYSLLATIRAHQWKETMILNNYIPQMATIVVAMLLLFPFVTHGQMGDGLVITQSGFSPFNHAARVGTIQTIDNILNEI